MEKGSPLVPLDPDKSREPGFAIGPLLLPGVVGLALVVAYLLTEDDPFGGLMLEVGAGMALFSALFFFERRFIVRFVQSQIESLREPMTPEEIEGNESTPGDFHGDFGPLFMASLFLGLVHAAQFDQAFVLMSASLREVRASAWLYNNKEILAITDENRDSYISRIASGPSKDDELWSAFAESEASLFQDATRHLNLDSLGWSHRRRILGPAHELILAFPIGEQNPHGILISGPHVVEDAVKIVLEAVELDGTLTYLVAGFNTETPPVPGWPPTMWNIYDPVAAEVHPGVSATPIRATLEEE